MGAALQYMKEVDHVQGPDTIPLIKAFQKWDNAVSQLQSAYRRDLARQLEESLRIPPPGGEPFTLIPQCLGGYQTLFWGVDQSDLYYPTGMVAPQYPLYHPYHPFLNVTEKDEIPQVPIAMPLLNYERMAPLALLKLLPEIKARIIPFFVVQTLPYGAQTPVIARYQYGLFPDGKRMMKGTRAIFAQGIVYEGDKEFARFPSTTITIHESKKDEMSPTILSGNSMALSNAGELQGKGLWSLVLGSSTNALGSNRLFSTVTQVYITRVAFKER